MPLNTTLELQPLPIFSKNEPRTNPKTLDYSLSNISRRTPDGSLPAMSGRLKIFTNPGTQRHRRYLCLFSVMRVLCSKYFNCGNTAISFW